MTFMKTTKLQRMAAVLTVAGLACAVSTALAQEAAPATAVPTVAYSAPAPQLDPGLQQILRLAQAKIGDDTIITFIRNSGYRYNLNADQIIYLRQQGISEPVVLTLLTQARPALAPATAALPAQAPAAANSYYSGQVAAPAAAPAVTYVQSAPAVSYYYQPTYQPYYYYPDYYGYAPVSFSWGWYGGYYGGGWGWYGGGWRGGGWHGGWSGGGWHGGGYGGGHGGGFGGGGHGGGGHGGGHR